MNSLHKYLFKTRLTKTKPGLINICLLLKVVSKTPDYAQYCDIIEI
jgi:hypothetical protein